MQEIAKCLWDKYTESMVFPEEFGYGSHPANEKGTGNELQKTQKYIPLTIALVAH